MVTLHTLVGLKEAARVWVRFPEDQFTGKTPLKVILEGSAGLVASLLDNIMIGHPS